MASVFSRKYGSSGSTKNLSDAKDKISDAHEMFESWNNKLPNQTKDALISHCNSLLEQTKNNTTSSSVKKAGTPITPEI